MKHPLLLTFLILASLTTVSQPDQRLNWWRDARFGMFIHWGLYAVPAGEWNDKTGYGEWIRTSAEIPLETYDQFRKKFNPVKFDAKEWVKLAKDAGMKYIVITAKHHDGFCMFDTKQTDFNIMNTPFGRDPMKDLAAACREYGLTFCFYYSIMDWHHPDYTPRREWEKDRSEEGAEFRRYVDYMKAQLKELLTNYGEIGILWFDGEWEKNWNAKLGDEIYEYCRSIQPNVILNNRVGAGKLKTVNGETGSEKRGGDYKTPEQTIPENGFPGEDWETCMTMNDHWGYNSHDKNFKSAGTLIGMLADIVSKGGNYLLNVGPTAEGTIPAESVERLKTIGTWMKVNGQTITGAQAGPFKPFSWGRVSMRSNSGNTRLYVTIFKPGKERKLFLEGCLNEPIGCFPLYGGSFMRTHTCERENGVLVKLGGPQPDTLPAVVVVDLKGAPDIAVPPTLRPEIGDFIDTLEVTLKEPSGRSEIRYTLNGKKPGKKSPRYSGSFLLIGNAPVGAACFRNGKMISGVARKECRKVTPLPTITLTEATRGKSSLENGLEYSYYEGAWDSVPRFNLLTPVKSGAAHNFSLDLKERNDDFALCYSGFIAVPETDVYSFYTASDDGSALWIDGIRIVSNDYLHARTEKTGHIALKEGLHRLTVEFFERSGSDELEVSWRSSAIPKQPLPEEVIFH